MGGSLVGIALMGACTGRNPEIPDGDPPTDGPGPIDVEDTATVPTPPGTGDTGGETGAPEVIAASCAPSGNPLRVLCAVTLAGEGDATLTLTSPTAPTRTFVSTGAVDHQILGWGLAPQTDYTWEAGDFSGSFTTGRLPEALQQAEITVTGTSWGFDAVLHPLECNGTDYFVMIDGEGRIVWFEPNDVYGGGMGGYEWSQASRTVLSLNSNRLLEQHVSGAVVLDLRAGTDFEDDLHHDVARWGDCRYLLFEYPQAGVDVDGIHVFQGNALVATFRLGDHFPVGGFGNDWAHANGLEVTDDGQLVLSLRNFDTILGIDGDPASPTFLDIVWQAAGSENALPDPDYRPIDGPREGFDQQHNASRHGDMLWVFDNQSLPESRAIRLRMDHQAGTLAVDAEWSFDRTCENHGGAIPLNGGGVLASCANAGEIWAFEEGHTEPSWTLEARCGFALGLAMARGIPVIVE